MTQFSRTVAHGARQPVARPGGAAHKLTIGAASVRTSTAFAAETEMIRIVATTDVWYEVGGFAVDATTSDVFLPAGVVEVIQVAPGADTHIAAIQNSAGGSMSVVEIG